MLGLGAVAATCAIGAVACSDSSSQGEASGAPTDSCQLGTEGCSCTAGGACDPGLECRSGLCVDPGGDGSSGTGDDGGSGGGGSGSSDVTSSDGGGVGTGGTSEDSGSTGGTATATPTTSDGGGTGTDPGSSNPTTSSADTSGPATTGTDPGGDPLAACADGVDGGWTFETADDDGNVGQYAQLALDSLGRPHVSYTAVYSPTLALKHAVRTSSGWVTEEIDGRDDSNNISGIAIDDNDFIHVSYRWSEDLTGRAMYASKQVGVGNWGRSEMDTGGPSMGAYSHIAVDTQNEPHMVYHHLLNDRTELWYLEYESAQWHDPVLIDTLDPYGIGRYPTIAVTSDSTVYVAYYDEPNGDLKVATRDGTWSTEIVDGEMDDAGEYSRVVLDSGDVPHVLYWAGSGRGLAIATLQGTTWDIDDVGVSYPWNVTATFDADDNLHVTYLSSELVYRRRVGGVWDVEVLLSGLDIVGGRRTGIALAPNGRQIHIIYRDEAVTDLLYATCGPG